jgi:hypothetical protein
MCFTLARTFKVKATLSSQSSHMVGFDITYDHHAMSRSRVATTLASLAWKYQTTLLLDSWRPG